MPTIYFYGPELKRKNREKLIQDFTEAAARSTGIDPSAFVVYLMPVKQDYVGVGGELLDKKLKKK